METLRDAQSFISASGRLRPTDTGARQEDWTLSSLDLKEPDKPSCPVLNSGLALSLETLASHDSWDQGLMFAETSRLIWRIALLRMVSVVIRHEGPSTDDPGLISSYFFPKSFDWSDFVALKVQAVNRIGGIN